MITPVLQTERIILRPPTTADAQAVFDNWATDADAIKYLRWNVHPSVDFTTKWLEQEEAKICSEKSYHWVFIHKETGDIFGSGGLSYNDDRGMFEIGYVIMRKYWGQGLATEAAGAMVDFAKDDLHQKKLYAIHAKENAASGNVLKKLGFVYQGEGEYTSFDGLRVFGGSEFVLSWGADNAALWGAAPNPA